MNWFFENWHVIAAYFAGALSKWLESKIRSKNSRNESVDRHTADLITDFDATVKIHFDHWVKHQSGVWVKLSESKDEIEKLAQQVKTARSSVIQELKPRHGHRLSQAWKEYFADLTGDVGLINRKSDKIVDTKHFDEILDKFRIHISDLRRKVMRGGVCK